MIRLCEKFVGKDHDADEIGIDDQYTQFFYSKDVASNVKDWIYNNRYNVYHLVEDITFNDLDDLIAQVNARGMEWDEEWEPLDKDSKTRGGLFGWDGHIIALRNLLKLLPHQKVPQFFVCDLVDDIIKSSIFFLLWIPQKSL